ncbi:MAG: hypothetical protein J0M12_08615 [Deltaproteobacteria bacterium]|nr:hypothetical protein [Deltaproteobacteria bacterium]
MPALEVRPAPTEAPAESLDQAATHGSRPNRSSAFLTMVSLSLGGLGVGVSSCSVPPMERFPDSGIHSLEVKTPEVANTCVQLDSVANKLERLETVRAQSAVLFWPILSVSPSLKQRYDNAVECHRELCRTTCDYKMQLLGVYGADCDVSAIGAWADKTSKDLDAILELVDYVQTHGGRWKSGWVAPAGYEFIKPIN